jgi:hypothetical protein
VRQRRLSGAESGSSDGTLRRKTKHAAWEALKSRRGCILEGWGRIDRFGNIVCQAWHGDTRYWKNRKRFLNIW